MRCTLGLDLHQHYSFLASPCLGDEKAEIESGYFVSLWLFLGIGRSLFVQGKGKRGSFWGFFFCRSAGTGKFRDL